MRGKRVAMKRLMCLVLAAGLLLGGCGVIRDRHVAGQEVPVSVLDLSGLEYYGRVAKSAVYFLNETSGTLMAELRTLVVDQDTNPAAAAIKELLKGTSNDSLTSVAPTGMTLDFIEYSKDIVNVYLKYDGEPIQDRSAYILEQAISRRCAGSGLSNAPRWQISITTWPKRKRTRSIYPNVTGPLTR